MERRKRIRRTGLLCLHCLENAAFYRARVAAPAETFRRPFWRRVDANFIDMALVEWCKVFGDDPKKAVHHWQKVVTEPHEFLSRLEKATGISEAALESYRLKVRAYRDQFVAHLDAIDQADVPDLQLAIETARFLFNYLSDVEDDGSAFYDAPSKADKRFQQALDHARTEYGGLN
jgi:hypothetical protein